MKKAYFALLMMLLVSVSLFIVAGCGSNATSGGSSGGGGGGATLTADIYVSTTGSDDAVGAGTASNPFKTIQHAMLVCSSHDVIGVYNGTYTEEVTWSTREYITLRGESMSQTTIEASGSSANEKRCIKIDAVPLGQLITIEYMTIRNGTIEDGAANMNGAGIWVNSTCLSPGIDLHFKNLFINNNKCNYVTSQMSGGGIYVFSRYDSVVMENCIVSNNKARSGGGILFAGGDNYIKNTEFKNNTSCMGGGIYSWPQPGTCTTMDSCVVWGNTATKDVNANDPEGAGVWIGDKGKIVNCVFFNNKLLTPGFGGGILHYNSSDGTLEIINCTIASNEAPGGNGGGITSHVPANRTIIKNCLIGGNLASVNEEIDNATPLVSYSNVKGGYTGAIDKNPSFTGHPPYTAVNDFMLTSNTTIEITQGGTFEGAPQYDITGTKLRSATKPSMGAFEY